MDVKRVWDENIAKYEAQGPMRVQKPINNSLI